MKKAIFLDRDGTIIIDKIYLNDPAEVEYLPGAVEGLRAMRDLGFALFVATNQSGIARGLVEIQNLYAAHERIRRDLALEGVDIAGFYYAPYAVESNHFMRKPKPGMLLAAAFEHGIDLRASWMIGDRDSDVQAGHAAGTRSILIAPSGAAAGAGAGASYGAEAVCRDLIEAARFISGPPS